MTTTYVGARNELHAFFKARFDAVAAGIIGYLPEVVYRNNERPTKPGSDKYWLRVSIQTVFAEQTALGECENVGTRRYTETGLYFIQIFGPKSDNGADGKVAALADALREGYRGKATEHHIWFRNARINELTPEELFYRSNVVTEFEYDEVS